MSDKKQTLRGHSYRRAKQRHNIILNRATRRDWIAQIQGGTAELIEKQSLRVSKWVIVHFGNKITVIYDNKRKELVTVL